MRDTCLRGSLHDEPRSGITAVALGAHGAAVKLDEVTNDGQAEAKPAVGTRARRIRLAEAIEHVGKECRVDANARIGDRQFDLSVVEARPDIDPSAGRP